MPDGTVEFGLVATDGSITVVKRRGFCPGGHHFQLDAHARAVHCTRCLADFDPFEALLEVGYQRERYVASYLHAKNEAARLEDEVEKLRHEIKNRRAELARVTKRLAQRRAVDQYEAQHSGEDVP